MHAEKEDRQGEWHKSVNKKISYYWTIHTKDKSLTKQYNMQIDILSSQREHKF